MSEKHIISRYTRKLQAFEEYFNHHRKSHEDTITLLQAKNARWRITLCMMISSKDGTKSIMIDEWEKPVQTLTKECRTAILKEMLRIKLVGALTQEIIGIMLGASTSSIQKDLAEITSGTGN